MKIDRNMNLDHLSERMGDGSREYAEDMRCILVEKFDGLDTNDVSDDEWMDAINEAVSE